MSLSKKIHATMICILWVFTGLLIATPIKTTPHYDHEVRQYEEAGHYDKALTLARELHDEALDQGLALRASELQQAIERVESELLSLGSSRLLFDENLSPRAKLLEILTLVGMPPLDKSQKEIIQINAWAQANLLRQQERWQEQVSKFEHLRPQIMTVLNELGLLTPSSAHFKVYDGAIVHGADFGTAHYRLRSLIEQWNQGVRFPRLYFLSGERPLTQQEEDQCSNAAGKNSDIPKTEAEMMQFVWNQLEVPDALRNTVSVFLIDAPMKKDLKSERLLRPTTDDTIVYWLKTEPPLGRYLAVTNVPYICRQDLVTRTLSPVQYGFDTIGSRVTDNETVTICLDELARLIFQTMQQAEHKSSTTGAQGDLFECAASF